MNENTNNSPATKMGTYIDKFVQFVMHSTRKYNIHNANKYIQNFQHKNIHDEIKIKYYDNSPSTKMNIYTDFVVPSPHEYKIHEDYEYIQNFEHIECLEK